MDAYSPMTTKYATIAIIGLMAVTNTAAAQPSVNNLTQADTVRAVRHIFQTRHRRAGIPLFIGVGYGVMGGTGYLFASSTSTETWVSPAIWLIASAPFLAWGLGQSAAIKHREKKVMAAYAEGQPLPPRIQRRLARSTKHLRWPANQ